MDQLNAESIADLSPKISELKKSYFMALGLSIKLIRVKEMVGEGYKTAVCLSELFDEYEHVDSAAYPQILQERLN